MERNQRQRQKHNKQTGSFIKSVEKRLCVIVTNYANYMFGSNRKRQTLRGRSQISSWITHNKAIKRENSVVHDGIRHNLAPSE